LQDLTVPEPGAGVPSELLAHRPDIRAAEARLEAARADVAAARAAFFPSLRLTGSLGADGNSPGSLFDGQNPVYAAGAGLLQPIFGGGRLKGQHALAVGAHAEGMERYRGTILAAFADVEASLAALHYLAQEEQLQAEAVEHAELALQLAEARYRSGA